MKAILSLALGFTAVAAWAQAPATTAAKSTQYRFEEKKGEYIDFLLGDKKLLRYMCVPHDNSTANQHELTFKPFHHVYDPVNGDTLLTNGAALKSTPGIVYPHHRGIFYAFNNITAGTMKCDTWHGVIAGKTPEVERRAFTQHEGVLEAEANDKHARQKCKLTWHGTDGKTFATEEREVTASQVGNGTLIDFDSVLKTDLAKVHLDGDPQHAGCHFRAAMEVALKIEAEKAAAKKENRKPAPSDTYYVRPDGVGKPGDTRNWDKDKKDARTINLPWDACSFVIQGKRYTVLRMVNPANPKEWRGSERDYGRFGDYFEWDLTPKTPLHVQYRYWVQPGEMTVEQCEAAYKEYTKK